MAPFPLLEILFAIAILFNQQGAQTFTITPPDSQPAVTWTAKGEGQWHAVDSQGADGGDWSYKDMIVTIRKDGSAKNAELVRFLEVHPEKDGSGTAVISKQKFSVGLRKDNVLVLAPQGEAGTLRGTVTIQYGKKP